jgi:hypothetical protein
MSEEILEQEVPETVVQVDSAEEAVKTLDDLWRNLIYQHREQIASYIAMQESVSAMSFDQKETRVDFTKMNEMRDQLVKLEGGLETINLYRTLVLKEEAQPWIEAEIQEKKKIKVRTRPGYEKYTDWEADQSETDATLNKVK